MDHWKSATVSRVEKERPSLSPLSSSISPLLSSPPLPRSSPPFSSSSFSSSSSSSSSSPPSPSPSPPPLSSPPSFPPPSSSPPSSPPSSPCFSPPPSISSPPLFPTVIVSAKKAEEKDCDPVKQLMLQRAEEKLKHMEHRHDSKVWATWRGEKLALVVNCLAHVDLECNVLSFGTLFITNFQLVFHPMVIRDAGLKIFSRGWRVPLGAISSFFLISREGADDGFFSGVQIECKNFDTIRLSNTPLNNPTLPPTTSISNYLQSVLFKISTPRFFAFEKKMDISPEFDGWFVFDPLREYHRLRLTSVGCRLVTTNTSYSLCQTYPSYFITLDNINDNELKTIANFRSKGRVPAVVWRHWAVNSFLVRCSQPRSGIVQARCKEDEAFFTKLRHKSTDSTDLLLVDARPALNAVANVLRGAGPENMEVYQDCHREFLGIANIHSARQDYHRLRNLILKNHHTNTPVTSKDIKSTGWLVHTRLFLEGSKRMAQTLKNGTSVVVHCSDGWDRTPVLSALCQIMLDPFYRSIRGFEVLIEKEFCSFGHKFQDRVGHHLPPTEKEFERAPIFLQFIECVWQLTIQFKQAFEFNETFLHLILHHLYSCRFGTFLCNSEYERRSLGVSQRSDSLWTIVNLAVEKAKTLTNALYDPDYQDPIFPNTTKVKFWAEYHRPSLNYS